MEPLFSPPLHKQRHQFVIDFIKKNKTKKVGKNIKLFKFVAFELKRWC